MERDDDLLELAVTRKDALAALSEGSRRRRALQEELDVSKTTCHRILRSFDERGLIRRTEAGYELTLFGRIVAEQTATFEERVARAARMRRLLELFDASDETVANGGGETVAFDVFADVEWTVAGDQSFSIDRGIERVEGVDVLRVLDWTPVPDLYHEKILRTLADNAARVESIYPKSEVKDRLERFPELHDELLERGARPRYWVYDDVPAWGMSIYDDALVELRAYDRQSGAYVLDATADDPDAVDWALDVFAEYRARSVALTEIDELPDWGDYSW
ncbi:helix-turn-helix transcriptional regulator [Natronoarchaeum mannanilyticum]